MHEWAEAIIGVVLGLFGPVLLIYLAGLLLISIRNAWVRATHSKQDES